jgi:hypothetical protein
MREMSTDQPDTTESPYMVPAGHFQFELSFVEYTHNDDNDVATDSFSIVPTNVKVGLLNNVDIQFVFTPHAREETKADGEEDVTDGFSDDTQIRLKINPWGNGGLAPPGLDETAIMIMPFVKFPTGSYELSNDHVAGGVILPLAVSLPADFGLGLIAEVDFGYNGEEDDYGVAFVHAGAVGHHIVGSLAGYVEYVSIGPHDTESTYQAIGSTGLPYALGAEWIVDTGLTFRISDNTDDVSPFVGSSFRF